MEQNKSHASGEIVALAVQGDGPALETLIEQIQDMIFNLSLRMLGTVADAEDATQEILIRVTTRLSSFRGQAAFKTWVYRIAANYLIDTKKHRFAQRPLCFEAYAEDICAGPMENEETEWDGQNRDTLAGELKLSCTNVMLQCFEPQTRCVYVLGTMFKINSQIAAEILDMSPENYRQKLSRARKKMVEFLSAYCGLAGSGACSCAGRVDYAVKQHRIDPQALEFGNLAQRGQALEAVRDAMEEMDDLSAVFETLPQYRSPVTAKAFVQRLMQLPSMHTIQQA